jgi:hypothetical protein
MRSLALAAAVLLFFAVEASAQDLSAVAASAAEPDLGRPLYEASIIPIDASADQSPAPAPVAFEYSDAYRTRAKIHKIASFTTLPLFATEVALGQSVYSSPSDAKRNAHIAVGTGIVGLFAVNTVTGVWNLWDARKDPNNRKLRLLHGILMLAADAGFVATTAAAPGQHDFNFSDARTTHRAVALTSIGIGTAGYLIMLFGNK